MNKKLKNLNVCTPFPISLICVIISQVSCSGKWQEFNSNQKETFSGFRTEKKFRGSIQRPRGKLWGPGLKALHSSFPAQHISSVSLSACFTPHTGHLHGEKKGSRLLAAPRELPPHCIFLQTALRRTGRAWLCRPYGLRFRRQGP